MEPSITCPNCGSAVKLTETLAAPLIEKVRKDSEQKLRQKEQDFARRETAIRDQEDALRAKYRNSTLRLRSGRPFPTIRSRRWPRASSAVTRCSK
jgi:hypothetical protein